MLHKVFRRNMKIYAIITFFSIFNVSCKQWISLREIKKLTKIKWNFQGIFHVPKNQNSVKKNRISIKTVITSSYEIRWNRVKKKRMKILINYPRFCFTCVLLSPSKTTDLQKIGYWVRILRNTFWETLSSHYFDS